MEKLEELEFFRRLWGAGKFPSFRTEQLLHEGKEKKITSFYATKCKEFDLAVLK